MASALFDTLQFFHVVGAMVVVGYLAVIPMWRASVGKTPEPTMLRAFLATLGSVQARLVLPGLGLLITTGLLMTIGPLAEGYDLLKSRYAQAGLIVALILAVIVASGLGGPVKKMLALAEQGEGVGPAMDKLWSEWRTALLAAAVLALAGTGLMVYGARA